MSTEARQTPEPDLRESLGNVCDRRDFTSPNETLAAGRDPSASRECVRRACAAGVAQRTCVRPCDTFGHLLGRYVWVWSSSVAAETYPGRGSGTGLQHPTRVSSSTGAAPARHAVAGGCAVAWSVSRAPTWSGAARMLACAPFPCGAQRRAPEPARGGLGVSRSGVRSAVVWSSGARRACWLRPGRGCRSGCRAASRSRDARAA